MNFLYITQNRQFLEENNHQFICKPINGQFRNFILQNNVIFFNIMNKKTSKIIYYTSTGLLTAIMLMSVGMYFFNHELVAESFTKLGFPAYLVYPLAIAKILGLIAIWTKKSDMLKEWAYAGFFFNLSLASSAHLIAQDTDAEYALMALVFLVISYVFERKLNTYK